MKLLQSLYFNVKFSDIEKNFKGYNTFSYWEPCFSFDDFSSTAKGYRQEEGESFCSNSRGKEKTRERWTMKSNRFGYIDIIKDLQTVDCRNEKGLWVYVVHCLYGPQQLGLGHSTVCSWHSPRVPKTGEHKRFQQEARRSRESLVWLQKNSSFSCLACQRKSRTG